MYNRATCLFDICISRRALRELRCLGDSHLATIIDVSISGELSFIDRHQRKLRIAGMRSSGCQLMLMIALLIKSYDYYSTDVGESPQIRSCTWFFHLFRRISIFSK